MFLKLRRKISKVVLKTVEGVSSVTRQDVSARTADSEAKFSNVSTEVYVHRLPVEVLEQIFRACFSGGLPVEPAEDFASAILTSAPCNISQVCSLWRAVALSSPVLWSQWLLFVRNATPETLKKLVKILKTWRERSKDTLLTAYIVVEGKDGDGRRELPGAADAQKALFDFLYKLEARWCKIKISIYAFHTVIPIKDLDPSKYQNLQELHFCGHPHFVPRVGTMSQDALVTFSNLRTVVLGDMWMTVRDLQIVETCIMLLRQAPLLETLEVLMAPLSCEFTSDIPVIMLPHLQHLILIIRKQPSVGFLSKFLLDHLNTPALKTLHIASRHSPPCRHLSSKYISDFIARCQPPVECLVLRTAIREADLIKIVRQLPTTTSLFLDYDCITRAQFLSALLEKHQDLDYALCPTLGRLGFVLYSDDVPLALDVLVSRWPSSFTSAVKRGAYARWTECTQSLKAAVANEDVAVLDDEWEVRFEHWAAGKGCRMLFGKKSALGPNAKPSLNTGLF